MRVIELQQKRAKLAAEARAMLTKAESAKRNLNTEERQQYDKVFADIDSLKIEIENRQKLEAEERELAQPAGPRVPPDDLGTENRSNPERWIDEQTGNEVDVLRGTERRFSEACGGEHRQIAGVPIEDLSLGRAVRALITGDWSRAQAERRAMAEGTSGAGGVLVPTQLWGTVIDLARARAVSIKAGAGLVPMGAKTLTIARVASDPSFAFKSESAPFDDGAITFEPVVLTAQLQGCLVKASRELAMDAANF